MGEAALGASRGGGAGGGREAARALRETGPEPKAPPRTDGRLPLLDVLRGAAILGTLGTNIWLFTAPGGEAQVLSGDQALSPLAAALTDLSAGSVLEGALRFLANGKFLSLLTVLFGVGLAIQFRSAAKRGGRWPGAYPWRALFLFAEGTVHFTLVFAWDVLMGYAVTALLVAWLLNRSQRVQTVMMWSHAALHVAVMGLLTALITAAPTSGAPQGTDPELVRLYAEGSYLEQVAFRLDHILVFRLEPIITFPLLVFLFFVGVRLFRAGAFDPDAAGRRLRSRLLRWGVGVGLPLNLATTLAGPSLVLVDRYLAAPVLALGLIGLIGRAVDRVGAPGPVTGAFSSLGRTALSGYVLQNLLCMSACYGFGLGLSARFAGTGPWWVLALYAAVCLVLLTGSSLWLRRFEHGPLEAVQKWALSGVSAGPRSRAAPQRSGR